MNIHNIWFRAETRCMRIKKSVGNRLKTFLFYPENDNSFKLSFLFFVFNFILFCFILFYLLIYIFFKIGFDISR